MTTLGLRNDIFEPVKCQSMNQQNDNTIYLKNYCVMLIGQRPTRKLPLVDA